MWWVFCWYFDFFDCNFYLDIFYGFENIIFFMIEFVKEYCQFWIVLELGEGNGNIYICCIMDLEIWSMFVDYFVF